MERCDCGLEHGPTTPPLQLYFAAIARGVPRLGAMKLPPPDNRTFMIPRLWVAAHGIDPALIPEQAVRYRWQQVR